MGVTIKNTIKFPKLEFQKDLRFIADNIFIPEIQSNIHKGEAIDGGAYPALDQKTIDRKKGAIVKRTFTKSGNIRSGVERKISSTGLSGFSAQTLIETGKLVRSFFSANFGKNSVKITLKDDRKKIGGYLQIDGIGKAKKHFNFFGINPKMEGQALAYIKNKINENIKSGKSK